jgi:hypothetical protein
MTKSGEDPIHIYNPYTRYFKNNIYLFEFLKQLDQSLLKLKVSNQSDQINSLTMHDISSLANIRKNDFIYFDIQNFDVYVSYIIDLFGSSSIQVSPTPDQLDKKSWIAEQVTSLSNDFADCIYKLSNINKLPILSTIRLYHYLIYGITASTDLYDQNNWWDYFREIQVQQNLSEDKKWNSVITVWVGVRDLFIECLCVFLATAGLETIYITALYRKEGLEKTKEYLQETVFDTQLIKCIQKINTENDLKNYFRTYLFDFIYTGINIGRSLKVYLSRSAKRAVERNNTPIIFDPIFSPRSFETTDEDDESFQDDKIVNKDFAFEQNRLSTERKKSKDNDLKRTEKDNFTDETIFKFSLNICNKKGYLHKYKLSGNPDNIIHYTQKIFSNLMISYSRKHYDDVMKAKTGVGVRQLKRYNKEMLNGAFDELLGDPKSRPKTISEIISDEHINDFNAIRKFKEKRQRHEKDGYVTQNQLIKTLRDLSKDPELNIKKKSRSTYNTVLKYLIESKQITVMEKGQSKYYLATKENFISIRNAISNYWKFRKSGETD